VAIKAELPEEYVTGAVLDALESPRVQEALRTGGQDAPRRTELLAKSSGRRRSTRTPAVTSLTGSSTGPTGWTSVSAPRTRSAPRAATTTGSPAQRRCQATSRRPRASGRRGSRGAPTGGAPSRRGGCWPVGRVPAIIPVVPLGWADVTAWPAGIWSVVTADVCAPAVHVVGRVGAGRYRGLGSGVD